jgi:transposase
MFIKITKSGPRRYAQLVEAFRDEEGAVRHRHVANLGRLDQSDPKLERLIASLRRATGQPTAEPPEFSRALEVGGPWVLTELWNRLGLSSCLRGLVRSDAALDVESLTRVMVLNRLCDARSKLGVLRWLEGVWIPGVDRDEVTHQRLLRAMDVLETHQATIMSRLAGLVRPLLDQDLNVVFYDLTTVRIHGEGDLGEGDLRAYGLSKDTGGIARQFTLGMVQSSCGMPLDFEVFAGNVGEVSTLLPIIERCVRRYRIKRVTLVADRGLLSVDQVDALKAMRLPDGVSLSWILAVPARRYGELMDPVVALHDEHLKDDRKPSVHELQHEGHRLVIAHDPNVAASQQAQRRAKIDQIESEAQTQINKLDRQDQGEKSPGRRATDAGAFIAFSRQVREKKLSKILKADLHEDRFSWDLDEAMLARQEAFDGKLILLTNDTELSPEAIIKRYKQLADIERGFRVLKQDIAMAPVFHRLPERIQAHALICFLALLLHRLMRPQLKELSPTAALEKLKALQRHHVKVGDTHMTGYSATNDDIKTILHQLQLPLPTPTPEAPS